MTYDCEQKGHHYHEPDGSVYQIASGSDKVQPSGTITLTCCHCGVTADVANRRAPKAVPIMRTASGCAR